MVESTRGGFGIGVTYSDDYDHEVYDRNIAEQHWSIHNLRHMRFRNQPWGLDTRAMRMSVHCRRHRRAPLRQHRRQPERADGDKLRQRILRRNADRIRAEAEV